MIRLAFAALFLALAAPVSAQVTGALPPAVPTLKAAVTVTSDLVRIGDLVANAGPLADVAIFRSPDIGTTGAVSVDQVIEALRPHHLTTLDTAGLTQVTVTRAGRLIGTKDIEARIAEALAERFGLGDVHHLVVMLDRDVRPIAVEASTATRLQVSRVFFDRRSGRFDVVIELPGAAPGRRALRCTGTAIEMAEVAVLTRPLGRGETVKASDIAIERRPKAEMAADAIGAANEAIGLSARQPLRAGQPLRRADLGKPEVVRRDDIVTLVYEVPGIVLTIRGKALESGAEGDVVSVLNPQSKRTVQGIVSGPGRVNIVATALAAPSGRADAAGATLASRLAAE